MRSLSIAGSLFSVIAFAFWRADRAQNRRRHFEFTRFQAFGCQAIQNTTHTGRDEPDTRPPDNFWIIIDPSDWTDPEDILVVPFLYYFILVSKWLSSQTFVEKIEYENLFVWVQIFLSADSFLNKQKINTVRSIVLVPRTGILFGCVYGPPVSIWPMDPFHLTTSVFFSDWV